MESLLNRPERHRPQRDWTRVERLCGDLRIVCTPCGSRGSHASASSASRSSGPRTPAYGHFFNPSKGVQ
jgi:hypothetical protein